MARSLKRMREEWEDAEGMEESVLFYNVNTHDVEIALTRPHKQRAIKVRV